MHLKEIKKIESHARTAVLKPLKSKKNDRAIDEESMPVIFGYDTEYTDTTILSFSLSCYDKDGNRQSDIFYVRADSITSKDIYAAIESMRAKHGIPRRTVYYLISHFSQADISRIVDFDKVNLIENRHTQLIEVSGTYIGSMKPNIRTTIKVLDLFTFFKTSLAKIGDILHFPKLKVSQFYKENMDVYLKEKPEEYVRYANRDAEIALSAWTELTKHAAPFDVSPIRYATAPALALAIFRKKFLHNPSSRINESDDGRTYYADNWRIRMQALKSYWGGHNENYYYGVIRQRELFQYDVKSLYPNAGKLQPLPNAFTEWKFLRETTEDILLYEGFVTIEFEYPEGVLYPVLPVGTKQFLAFPSKGISHCTISELRVADMQGATWRVIQGYGFIPTKDEINHDLVAFFDHFTREKDNIDKDADPFNYAFVKLMMNSLIGKFVQRKSATDTIKVAREYGVSVSELGGIIDPRLAKIKEEHTDTHLGSGFSPEWAALILGKSRAIIGEIAHYNKPYMVVTDSVLIDHPLIRCKALDDLERVGSGLALEKSATSAYLLRLRTYWLIDDYYARIHDPDLEILASLGGGSLIKWVVKKAVHGLGVRPNDDTFDESVLRYVYDGVPLPPKIERVRLCRFREAWRKRVRWNSEIVSHVSPRYLPDEKRRILSTGWSVPLLEVTPS